MIDIVTMKRTELMLGIFRTGQGFKLNVGLLAICRSKQCCTRIAADSGNRVYDHFNGTNVQKNYLSINPIPDSAGYFPFETQPNAGIGLVTAIGDCIDKNMFAREARTHTTRYRILIRTKTCSLI